MFMKTNSLESWIVASRPKTLAAAATPVIVGSALAYFYEGFHFMEFVACLLFALAMQVAANLINDMVDCMKGTDNEERLGPERAMANGWITPKAMNIGILVVVAFAGLCGLALMYMSSWKLIFVGLLCVLFAFLYTAGPFPLSYNGLGDVAVVVFFGIVPVCFTCYVQCGLFPITSILMGIAVGFVVDTLLVVNNYRDIETDKKSKKNTLIVILGSRFGEVLYLVCGIVAMVVAVAMFVKNEMYYCALLEIVYLISHISAWRRMCQIKKGKALNQLIAVSSRNMLLYALISSFGLCVCK